MPFLETIEHEPAPSETLHMEPAFRHEHVSKEYVNIGVVEPTNISLQIVHFDHDYHCTVLQAALTGPEIDIVIKALQEAKDRMEVLNHAQPDQ
jgi:hypothetical protein